MVSTLPYLVPNPALQGHVDIRQHPCGVELGVAGPDRGVGALGDAGVVQPLLDLGPAVGRVDQPDRGDVVA